MHCPCNSEPLARAHPGPVPPQCPRIVALLAESFNPHVRYGAAMAVGIACAGSGGREAVALLEGMAAEADFMAVEEAVASMAAVRHFTAVAVVSMAAPASAVVRP